MDHQEDDLAPDHGATVRAHGDDAPRAPAIDACDEGRSVEVVGEQHDQALPVGRERARILRPDLIDDRGDGTVDRTDDVELIQRRIALVADVDLHAGQAGLHGAGAAGQSEQQHPARRGSEGPLHRTSVVPRLPLGSTGVCHTTMPTVTPTPAATTTPMRVQNHHSSYTSDPLR